MCSVGQKIPLQQSRKTAFSQKGKDLGPINKSSFHRKAYKQIKLNFISVLSSQIEKTFFKSNECHQCHLRIGTAQCPFVCPILFLATVGCWSDNLHYLTIYLSDCYIHVGTWWTSTPRFTIEPIEFESIDEKPVENSTRNRGQACPTFKGFTQSEKMMDWRAFSRAFKLQFDYDRNSVEQIVLETGAHTACANNNLPSFAGNWKVLKLMPIFKLKNCEKDIRPHTSWNCIAKLKSLIKFFLERFEMIYFLLGWNMKLNSGIAFLWIYCKRSE